jgi:excisionase family DNA binding protein
MGAEDRVTVSEMPQLLTPREAALLLHVHESTLRRWSDQGVIRAYRISPRGDRRFRRDDLNRLLLELGSATKYRG